MADQGIKYVNPLERNYCAYKDHLIAFNRKIQEEISGELSERFRSFEGSIGIATTGSDARLEKGPVSPIEIMLLGDQTSDFERATKLVKDYIFHNKTFTLFDEDLELKDVSKDTMSYCTWVRGGEEARFISPNRIFDVRILYDNGEIYQKVIDKFVSELKSSDKGRLILNKAKEKYKEYSRIASTGMQQHKGFNLFHYDLEKGVSVYDPKNKLFSFKQGPLRAVQNALVRDSIKSIRKGRGSGEILSLPKNTVEKLNRLDVENKSPLSSSDIEVIADCYKYFLHLYHRSQAVYKERGQKEIEFMPREAKDKIGIILELCSSDLGLIN